MGSNKIFRKMFLMTLSLAMTLLFVQFVFQYFWLDDFYYYNKSKQAERFIESIEETLKASDVQDADVDDLIRKKAEQYDSFMAVFNQYGEQYYGLYLYDDQYITMLSGDNEVYKVFLDGFGSEEDLIEALALGQDIEVKGYVDQSLENIILPEWITIDGKTYGAQIEQIDLSVGLYDIQDVAEFEEFELEDEALEGDDYVVSGLTGYEEDLYLYDQPQVVVGQVVSLNLDQFNKSGMAYKENQLFDEQFNVFASDQSIIDQVNKDAYIAYEVRDEYTGIKSLVSIKRVVDFYGQPLYIFSIMSLESVAETTQVTLSYFYITVVVALILAVLFSYFYSRKITRPILHLHDVTAKLAEVDFSTRCDVRSRDEIEDLANSINIMAERLERTLKQLKQFLADASHELKTPLTVLQGIVEGMIDGVYDTNNPDHYELMRSEINDMTRLVYDLLELSKLESGEVTFKKDVFQVSDVILKTHKKLGVLVNDKALAVTLDLDETFVSGNEAYIETVVRNFYTNAIRYTEPRGHVHIRMLEEADTCTVEIENWPSRLSEEGFKHLWQPFFREDASRNKATGGTGLGLYMVKTILDQHGCDYSLENTCRGVKASFSLKIERE